MRFAVLLCLCGLAGAQQPPDPYETIRLAMDPSLARQRESVRKQAESARQIEAGAGDHPFFTVPWPALVQMLNAANCDPLPKAEAAGYIQDAARREGVDPDLLRAVIRQESGFRPCAVSPAGAQGLMQLMPATAGMLNVRDPFDARENIDAGARLLKMLLARYSGDLALALGAYNAGPGAVDRHGGVPPYRETLNYVSGILNGMQ